MRVLILTNKLRAKYVNYLGGTEKLEGFFDFIVDISKLAKPAIHAKAFNDELKTSDRRLIFLTVVQFKHFLGKYPNSEFFIYNPVNFSRMIAVLKAIKSVGGKYSYIMNKSEHDYKSNGSHPSGIGLKLFVKRFFFTFYGLLKGFNNPVYVFINGYKKLDKLANMGFNTEVVLVNNQDFDKSLLTTAVEGFGRFAVFVEQPFHIINRGVQRLTDEQQIQYYNNLHRDFKLLKELHHLDQVVICCHPNTDIKNLGHPVFTENTTVPGQTDSFIKSSIMVLVHFSNAIDFAVVNQKPIVSIYYDGIFDERMTSFILDMHNKYDTVMYKGGTPGAKALNVKSTVSQKYILDEILNPSGKAVHSLDIIKETLGHAG